MLGEIFRDRGMLPLAIKKLQNATTNQEISRGNVKAFYGLATCYEANEEPGEATDLAGSSPDQAKKMSDLLDAIARQSAKIRRSKSK